MSEIRQKETEIPDIQETRRKKSPAGKTRKKRAKQSRKKVVKPVTDKKKKKLGPLAKLLIKITVLTIIVVIVLTWILGLHRMTGNNMFPFVKDGDLCIAYKLDDYTTGDVVLYRNDEGKMKLGRIVAVGGQSVDFPKDGGYTVDGYQPSEEITYQTFGADGVKYPIDVGEDEAFIMNDFRSDTDDSRQFGCVKKSDIDGKLLFLIRRRGF